ncbi:MAG: helix-turn-helix transcriptional regulator [Alphaproteobacteria bacterium]|nr:helix-turn-helix transcriptional regulator [Alphaproteobacteria bacterium]MBV8406107.1 helix-turn-helix transcriptional regulator [Alphaproteobacteria bacterium]
MASAGTALRQNLHLKLRTVPVIMPSLLAKALKAARRQHSLTIREAAQLAGVSAATYSRLERGQRAPDVDTLLRLTSFILSLRERARHR